MAGFRSKVTPIYNILRVKRQTPYSQILTLIGSYRAFKPESDGTNKLQVRPAENENAQDEAFINSSRTFTHSPKKPVWHDTKILNIYHIVAQARF
jgi:hypothetical protein